MSDGGGPIALQAAEVAAGDVGPVGIAERVAELDVLRGVALFGVFLMNMIGLCSAGIMSTDAQLFALPTAALDRVVTEIGFWLFSDKANSLFAFLFGMGFYLQMQRAEARGADFARIYKRRLTVLLLFGLFHLYFIWTWDVLHLYAMAGFALLALRRVDTRTLLIGGILLTLFDWRIPQELLESAGLAEWHGFSSTYSEAAVLARQQVSAAGDYFGTVRAMASYTLLDYVLSGSLAGWFVYALGRFMLGAWVGRNGWLQHAQRHLPGFRRVMFIALPAGLLLAGFARIVEFGQRDAQLSPWDHWEIVERAVHAVSAPLLATGYVCAVVVALHTHRGRKLLAPFAYAGRMALSNYVAQSFVYALLLFGIGPGLALAGKIGSSVATLIVIVAYAAQVVLSRWWLARFRFGPLEWAWRGLTYGAWPRLRISPALS